MRIFAVPAAIAFALTFAAPAFAPEATTGSVAHNWSVASGKTRVLKLTAHKFNRPGVKVQILCNGKGCPFKVKNVRVRGGQAKAATVFKRRKLRTGVTVSVLFAAPGTTGRFVVFTTRRSAIPSVKSACGTFDITVPTGCVGPQGPAGPQGPGGPAGPAGPRGANGSNGSNGSNGLDATKLWAVVNSDGTIARSSGTVSSASFGSSGFYEVIFNRDITNCAFIGSLGDAGGGTVLGFFSAVRRGGQPNGIFVSTANTAGTGTNEPFHVGVFC